MSAQLAKLFQPETRDTPLVRLPDDPKELARLLLVWREHTLSTRPAQRGPPSLDEDLVLSCFAELSPAEQTGNRKHLYEKLGAAVTTKNGGDARGTSTRNLQRILVNAGLIGQKSQK
jgi:hypothetical protein